MAESRTDLPFILKELRRTHKLTQVQLANELGLSPATVYRYESGARADASALMAISAFASAKGPRALANGLRSMLSERMALFRDSDQDQTGQHVGTDSGLDALNSVAASLPEEQKLQLLAFATLLRQNTDPTVEKMLNLLLEPWVAYVQPRKEKAPRERSDKPKK